MGPERQDKSVYVTDSDGRIIYEEKRKEIIYSSPAAETMTDVLTGVPIRGTAAGMRLDNGCQIAGKTGTTNNVTNTWFCGYTSYYTIACWVGTDSGTPSSELGGTLYARSIWRDVMNSLVKDKKAKQLVQKTNSLLEKSNSGQTYSRQSSSSSSQKSSQRSSANSSRGSSSNSSRKNSSSTTQKNSQKNSQKRNSSRKNSNQKKEESKKKEASNVFEELD